MIYEVCVLVLTIIISVIGIHLVIVLHNTKGLLTELRQAVKSVNKSLPVLLSDVESTVAEVENLTKTARECVDVFEGRVLGPMCSIAGFLNAFKVVYKVMQRKSREESKTKTDETEQDCREPGLREQNAAEAEKKESA